MKRILKVFVVVLVVAFVALQFIFRIDKTAPPVVDSETLEAAVTVPDNVRTILDRSCTDCHTYKTQYPWYSNIVPSSWFLSGHIEDGRRHLNLSVFNTYTPKKKVQKLEEICEQVDSKEMPLPSYLWIHWDAGLNADDVKTLCEWSTREKEKIQP